MMWQGKELLTAGEITDEALRVARDEPELAPLFLAQYAVRIARATNEEDPASVAVSNLHFMAGHYDKKSERTISRTYGHPHIAREATRS